MYRTLYSLTLISLLGLLLKPSEQGGANDDTWDKQAAGIHYKDEYSSVNRYLVEEVDNSSMPVNMAALVVRMSLTRDQREIVVLKKLVGMKITEGRCDKISYQALKDNDDATDYKSHDVTSKRAAPRRIDKLINYYSTQHATICQKTIEALFKKKLTRLDSELLFRLSTWLDPIIDRYANPYLAGDKFYVADVIDLYHGIIKNNETHPALFDIGNTYNVIKNLMDLEEQKYLHYYSNELTGQREFHPTKMINMFDKYIDGSCKKFIDQIGELFERAYFDAIFYHNIHAELHDPDQRFYRAWAYDKLCREFIESKQERHRSLADEINEYARAIANRVEVSQQ